MASIGFSTRPHPEHPDADSVVVLIDGTPLTDLIHDFERARRMETRAVSYDGLIPSHARCGSAAEHWSGTADTGASRDGRVQLLACDCGEWGCWPLFARVERTAGAVTWSHFSQPFRPLRDYSALGPFTFDADDYDAAVSELAAHWDRALVPAG